MIFSGYAVMLVTVRFYPRVDKGFSDIIMTSQFPSRVLSRLPFSVGFYVIFSTKRACDKLLRMATACTAYYASTIM
eukprot:scaffold687_cov288-Chaetoceros_neogracile.AAC.24